MCIIRYINAVTTKYDKTTLKILAVYYWGGKESFTKAKHILLPENVLNLK